MAYGDSYSGKWYRAVFITGSLLCTGSFANPAGFIIGNGYPASGSVYLNEGDSIDISKLIPGIEYNFSISSVYMTSGSSYVLYKNPIAHW